MSTPSDSLPQDDSNTFIALDEHEHDTEEETDFDLDPGRVSDHKLLAEPTTPIASLADATAILDSPIDRMTIDQLTIDQLDAELERIRAKRIEYVVRLEKTTKVRAGARQSNEYIKFAAIAEKAKDKLELAEKRLTDAYELINKLRMILLSMGEV